MQAVWKTVWQMFKMLNMEIPHDPVISLLCIHPTELKTCPHKNSYTNVHRRIIHNIQKVETQRSINYWMDNRRGVYPCNEILLGHEKEQNPDTRYYMDGPWKHDAM